MTGQSINCLKRINCLMKCYCLFTFYANNIHFCCQLSKNFRKLQLVTPRNVDFQLLCQGVIVIHAEDLRHIHGFQTGFWAKSSTTTCWVPTANSMLRWKCLSQQYLLILGEKKLICWSIGPTNPILSKKKKDITTFWPTGFFQIFSH